MPQRMAFLFGTFHRSVSVSDGEAAAAAAAGLEARPGAMRAVVQCLYEPPQTQMRAATAAEGGFATPLPAAAIAAEMQQVRAVMATHGLVCVGWIFTRAPRAPGAAPGAAPGSGRAPVPSHRQGSAWLDAEELRTAAQLARDYGFCGEGRLGVAPRAMTEGAPPLFVTNPPSVPKLPNASSKVGCHAVCAGGGVALRERHELGAQPTVQRDHKALHHSTTDFEASVTAPQLCVPSGQPGSYSRLLAADYAQRVVSSKW